MASGKVPAKQLGAAGGSTYETEGDQLTLTYSGVTTPGTQQTLISHTVSAGMKNYLLCFFITCRIEGVYQIYYDSSLIASGRTNAASPNDVFYWRPYHLAEESKVVEVKYTGMSGRPASDLECYLQARDVTV